ncbi:MAG: hypothetical protein ABMA26_13920 [Limisphaerales bacterium]
MKPALRVLLALACSACLAAAAETAPLAKELELFRPHLGKTWRGEFKNSTPDKPVVDISRWERVLNGQAIRVLHSINDGIYGGESIIRWDKEKASLTFHYFTTAGFMTTGTMTFSEGKFISHEKVSGSANGVTEVRATSEFRADGTLHVKAEYLKNGEWSLGRETTYREQPKAEVKFK